MLLRSMSRPEWYVIVVDYRHSDSQAPGQRIVEGMLCDGSRLSSFRLSGSRAKDRWGSIMWREQVIVIQTVSLPGKGSLRKCYVMWESVVSTKQNCEAVGQKSHVCDWMLITSGVTGGKAALVLRSPERGDIICPQALLLKKWKKNKIAYHLNRCIILYINTLYILRQTLTGHQW